MGEFAGCICNKCHNPLLAKMVNMLDVNNICHGRLMQCSVMLPCRNLTT